MLLGGVRMKKYLITSLVFLGILLITGGILYFNSHNSYKLVNSIDFSNIVREEGYIFSDYTNEYDEEYLKNYYMAKKDNKNITYVVMNDSVKAKNLYTNIKATIMSYEGKKVKYRSDINLKKFNKYEVTSNGKYGIVIKKNNVIIYSLVDEVNKSDIKDIYKKLGYDTNYLYLLFWGLAIFDILLIYIVSLWKLFVKCNRRGFLGVIPLVNLYYLNKIVMIKEWLFLLLFIPVVNFFYLIYFNYHLAKVFGKKNGYVWGLLLLNFIFLPMLVFDNSKYKGISR